MYSNHHYSMIKPRDVLQLQTLSQRARLILGSLITAAVGPWILFPGSVVADL